MKTERITDRWVDLWYVDPCEVDDPRLLELYSGHLDAAEQLRHRRFVFLRDRHSFLVSRTLVRTVLSRYADLPPRDWTFRLNPYGRPEIDRPEDMRSLRFSLSHTQGLIVCSVTRDLDIGVDVENTTSRIEAMAVAEDCFAADELAALLRVPDKVRRGRFFELWTLKESYLKARGLGLSLPLDQFWFEIADGVPIRITFGSAIDDDPAAWQFALLTPSPVHQLALAVGRGHGPDCRIALRKTIPLVC